MTDITSSCEQWTNPRRALALFVIAVAATVATGTYRDAIVDDAFIYLRVARNLATLGEWSFNAGAPVNPCSGPLYVLVAALFGLVCGFDDTALLVSFFLGIFVTGVLLAFGMRRRSWLESLGTALVVVLAPTMLRSVGMETPLFVAVVVASGIGLERRAWGWCGAWCAIAHLLRPEGALLVPVIAGLAIARGRGIPWRLFLVAALIVIPWYTVSYAYFDALLPHSVTLKRAQSSIGWWAMQPSFLNLFFSKMTLAWMTGMFAAIGIVRIVRLKPTCEVSNVLVGFSILQIAVFQLMRAPAGYPWYHLTGHCAFTLLWVAGIVETIERLTRPGPAWLGLRGREFGVAAALLAAPWLGVEPISDVPRTFRESPGYRAAAEWLKANTGSSDSVGTAEIGYIGFFSERPTVDLHGLIHPAHFEQIRAGIPGWWRLPLSPDYLLAHDPRWPNEPTPINWTPEALTEFALEYEEVWTGRFPNTMFENGGLMIFKRREPRIRTSN